MGFTTRVAMHWSMQSRSCLEVRAVRHNRRDLAYLRHSLSPHFISGCYTWQRSALLATPQPTTHAGSALRRFNSHLPYSSPSATKSPGTAEPTSVTHYTPPKTGLVASLPQSWIPYAELIRLDKPTGTYYLFFPCAFSTLLAAPMTTSTPFQVLGTMGLFLAGALVMRGAGCTINDLWDRNLDPHVERTKFRPIARRAVSPRKAVVFTGMQLLAGLGILLQFPTLCLWYGIPSLLLVTTYPLAKRITYYPQAVLGLTFSWGAMMGFPALGIDLLNNYSALESAAALYSSCVAWTILYDMIYAHMDIKDDVAAGIKSIALRHEHNTKTVLSALAVVQVTLLAAAGVSAGAGPVFFIGSCGSAALSLGIMIWRVQLKNVQNCWWWFKNGCLLTGGGITMGMLFDYIVRATGLGGKDTRSPQVITDATSKSNGELS
ncbi:UbiA prenyltransferase family-domain-containing protein [Aspergillus pseudotamarii]|uniref:4-hydroxybenzoate polyprenyltransferase, mitochondrial n=1 Tax=Aspergillus pseudotamarii TaxID=132259 RepID=A0A5N6SCH1_ASPPS|nr:UbiA prenyltransferase family-domain-containing protein [Aspergillus pseudotamarii]KAE8132285.1 UbiA prenyltransferase family-domain-containing protein [Aspergillus pseudotamarii]